MRNINLKFASTTSNYSRTEFFKNWFEQRGLKIVGYQQDILSNKLTFNEEPMVLAVSPGGGKTMMSIAAIDKYLLDNPNHNVLVLTHGQTILRSQYAENILDAKPNFSWSTVVSDLDNMNKIPQIKSNDIESSKVQVIVSLPQSLITTVLPHFDFVVVDEAHEFYFADMVKSIIRQITPQNQLLLTGSPSPFIARKFANIIPVSLEILLEQNMVCDPIIEIVGSTYDFNYCDYNVAHELKKKINIKTEDTQSTLDMVLKEICKKLKIESNWNSALKILSKTMIVCRRKEQAEDVHKFFKDENINVALSLSKNDKDSTEIQRFKKEDDCLILIVIRRGILGFNFNALTNVIDISCSQNIDKILQLLCRVVRISPKNEQKTFYKVCPLHLVEHFKNIMTAVLSLSNQEYFMKFNGKNFLNLPLLAIKVKESEKDKAAEIKKEGEIPRNKCIQFKPFEFSGLPAFAFFKNCIADINNKTLSSYAFTTLREVSQNFISWKTISISNGLDRCVEIYKNNNCKKICDYINVHKSGHVWLKENGLLVKFYDRTNIKTSRFFNKSVDEIFNSCCQAFFDNKCIKMADYHKADLSGYFWLQRHGLLVEFRKRLGLNIIKIWPRNLSINQRFESCYNDYIFNKHKTIKDYSTADKSGYSWLQRNGLLDKFQKKVNCKQRIRTTSRFIKLTNKQGLESCIKIFLDNCCKSSGEYSKIDSIGYQWLYRNGLLGDFFKRVNLEVKRSRFDNSNKKEGVDLCCKLFLDNNCKTIKDYRVIDKVGYSWLFRNNLLTDFYKRLNLTGKTKSGNS